MGSRKSDSDALPSVAEAVAEGAPQGFPEAASEPTPPEAGTGGGDPPPPAEPTAPALELPEAGVSFVRYQGPKDKKTNRQPKAVRAIVVGVEGSTCTLKLLDRKDSPRVEGVAHSAERVDTARWFW